MKPPVGRRIGIAVPVVLPLIFGLFCVAIYGQTTGPAGFWKGRVADSVDIYLTIKVVRNDGHFDCLLNNRQCAGFLTPDGRVILVRSSPVNTVRLTGKLGTRNRRIVGTWESSDNPGATSRFWLNLLTDVRPVP